MAVGGLVLLSITGWSSVVCSFFPLRYHKLLVQKYGSKREKALATKRQASKEGLSVWETEKLLDVELFLEGQSLFEKNSPHHLAVLHEMFQYSYEQGQEEVECMVC